MTEFGRLSCATEQPIDCVEVRSDAEFAAALTRSYDAPLVLRGGLEGCRAMQWTASQLAEAVGPKPVAVYTLDSAEARTLPPSSERRHTEMLFDEFIRRSVAGATATAGETRYYLAQCRDIPSAFPTLAGDLPCLSLPSAVQESNFFMGSANIGIGLHHDIGIHGLLCQIVGRKRAVLFPPEDALCLYPYGTITGNIAHCRVRDVDAVDVERFPLFRHARAYTTVLEPGDVLFTPAFWWHSMRTMTWGVSVNYFFADPEFAHGGFSDTVGLIAQLHASLAKMSPRYRRYCAARVAAEMHAFGSSAPDE